MVNKKPAIYDVAPRRNAADGAWLCNVIAGCDEPAVQQASADALPKCSGCGLAGGELKENARKRRDELEAANHREEAIKTAARSRADAGDAEPYKLLDLVELKAIAERRQLLGIEIEGIEAEHARVVDDHTHPLFACAKHLKRLPQ